MNPSVQSTSGVKAKRSSHTILEAKGEEISLTTTPLTTTRLVEADLDSPRSVTALVSPPSKRQKQVIVPSTKRLGYGGESPPSILEYVQGFDVAGHIFTFAGPLATARCAQVCKSWKHASERHLSLWRTFVEQDFGLPKGNYPMDRHWHRIYAKCTSELQKTPWQHLEASVVFADDGGNFPGYPAQHALIDSMNMVWCTSTGADRNVDLVVELGQLCLLTGFRAANGGRGYSAPLQQGLVFVGVDPPDLESARCYNVQQGDHNGGELGSNWVRHLFQPEKKSVLDDLLDELAPPEEGNVEPPQAQAPLENNGANEEAANGQNNDDAPRQRSAEAPPTTPDGAPTPVAAFHFPDLSEAYLAKSEQTLGKPRLARYIHFKLLTSHSPPGLEHISDNMDLMNFLPIGIPMRDVQHHIPLDDPVIPDYPRQHEVRQSRMAAIPLDNELGPWFQADFF